MPHRKGEKDVEALHEDKEPLCVLTTASSRERPFEAELPNKTLCVGLLDFITEWLERKTDESLRNYFPLLTITGKHSSCNIYLFVNQKLHTVARPIRI